MAETVYLASLGCAKNLVNSEQMLALIEQAEGLAVLGSLHGLGDGTAGIA